MTATTTLARNGGSLSYPVQVDGWYSYINDGPYTEEQQDKLADALMAAQEREFDAMLPPGCFWHPHTSEVTGPADADLDSALAGFADIDAAMEAACERVTARFDEIEREALGR